MSHEGQCRTRGAWTRASVASALEAACVTDSLALEVLRQHLGRYPSDDGAALNAAPSSRRGHTPSRAPSCHWSPARSTTCLATNPCPVHNTKMRYMCGVTTYFGERLILSHVVGNAARLQLREHRRQTSGCPHQQGQCRRETRRRIRSAARHLRQMSVLSMLVH